MSYVFSILHFCECYIVFIFSYCIVIITIYICYFCILIACSFKCNVFSYFFMHIISLYIYICIACVHKWSIQLIDAFHQVVGRREATCPQLKTMLFADFAATQNPVILDGYLYILGFIGNGYLYRIGCNNLF